MAYRFLFLGDVNRKLTKATLEEIDLLAEQGAIIVGPRPVGSPSLADDDEAFERLVSGLWDRPSAIETRAPAVTLERLEVPVQWPFVSDQQTDRRALAVR